MPQVSVIIPTYNRSHYLKHAINSVLNQTFQDFEIIIIDNGSTDNTRDVVKTYGPQIKYFYYSEKQGPAPTMNYGVRNSNFYC